MWHAAAAAQIKPIGLVEFYYFLEVLKQSQELWLFMCEVGAQHIAVLFYLFAVRERELLHGFGEPLAIFCGHCFYLGWLGAVLEIH